MGNLLCYPPPRYLNIACVYDNIRMPRKNIARVHDNIRMPRIPTWIQRVFWAFTEGAVATALLVAGGSDALGALQAASIVFGLPYNFFLFIMCASIVKMCQVIESEQLEDSGIVDASFSFPTNKTKSCETIICEGSMKPNQLTTCCCWCLQ